MEEIKLNKENQPATPATAKPPPPKLVVFVDKVYIG